MKVLVMGSGVIGVTTAYCLARDGHEVAVVDRHAEPAAETSFANAGLIAPGHAYTWASPSAPMILLRSLYRNDQAFRLRLRPDPRMWGWFLLFLRCCTAERARVNTIRKLGLCRYSQEVFHEVAGDAGIEYDGRTGGLLYLYRTPASFAVGAEKARLLEENGQRLELVDRERVAEIEPSLAPVKDRIEGGIYCPTDESGDARLFTSALAEACRERLGVRFHFGTTIMAIDTEGDRVRRVVTDKGDHRADIYVLALGCQSPLLARPIGIRLPIYPVKGYSVTVPVGPDHRAPAHGGVDEDNFVAFARLGDRFRLTATAEFAGYDTGHAPGDFTAMLRAARDLFPDAGDYGRPTYWAGLRPMTPEGTPILGRCRYGNLFLNSGQGHMGWTMACGSARITADLIAGRAAEIDLDGMTLQ